MLNAGILHARMGLASPPDDNAASFAQTNKDHESFRTLNGGASRSTATPPSFTPGSSAAPAPLTVVNPSAICLIAFASIMLFILCFFTASSWLLTAKYSIKNAQSRYGMAIVASIATLVTVGAAMGFAVGTRDLQLSVPVDIGAVQSNLNLDLSRRLV
jgi:hypothetical protein